MSIQNHSQEVHVARTIENPATGQRLAFLAVGADTDGPLFRGEGTFSPGGRAGVEHHPPAPGRTF